MDEREMIIKAKRGDRQAFELLVNLYKNRAFSFVFVHIKNREDAKDIVQEVFIKLYENLGKIDENRKFFSYFYKMVQNSLFSFYRKKRNEKLSNDPDLMEVAQSWNNDSLSMDEKLFLMNALDSLQPDEKNLVILRFFEGMNDSEVSELTGLTEQNVRVKMHRARKKLLRYVEVSND